MVRLCEQEGRASTVELKHVASCMLIFLIHPCSSCVAASATRLGIHKTKDAHVSGVSGVSGVSAKSYKHGGLFMQGLEHMAKTLNDLAAEMKSIREEVHANLKEQLDAKSE